MKRREFIAGLGSAAALPLRAHSLQAHAQPPAMPVVGLLRSTPAAPFAGLVAAFRNGLREAGFEDGRNVVIEERWADNELARLPALARELLQRQPAVIVGNQSAIEAAKAVSGTTPLLFVSGDDPVRTGLVASLSRPGGNVTGVTFFGGSQLNAKRMEILRELVPHAATLAVLGDPGYPAFERELPDVEATARIFNWQIVVARAASERELEAAFASFARAGAHALLVGGSPFFTSQRDTLVARAARHRLPAIYDVQSLVVAGGLISYSSSLTGAYRQAADYAGRILKGAKPAELPVLRATTFQLAINLKAAKALGMTVPPTLLARADEVIE